jgi:hypothetical protein
VGIKWEVTPCLPQEPHCFNRGSSQLIDCDKKTLTCYSIGLDDYEWTNDKIVPIP